MSNLLEWQYTIARAGGVPRAYRNEGARLRRRQSRALGHSAGACRHFRSFAGRSAGEVPLHSRLDAPSRVGGERPAPTMPSRTANRRTESALGDGGQVAYATACKRYRLNPQRRGERMSERPNAISRRAFLRTGALAAAAAPAL